jgi:hypothetical protein
LHDQKKIDNRAPALRVGGLVALDASQWFLITYDLRLVRWF